MRTMRIWLLLLILCAAAGAAVTAHRKSPAQDAMMLDRRIGTLEQRLYSIESRMSGIEQQAATARRAIPNQTGRDPEIDRMRSEVELLKGRVRELECGLVRLDERTMAASMKEARKRAGAQDPCRLNSETPVRLSTRQ